MDVTVVDGDLPGDVTAAFLASKVVGVDTETTGLDWSTDKLRICQLFSPTVGAVILRGVDQTPVQLGRIMASVEVLKVFHHAPFDLRFIESQWHVPISYLACTKAGSKLLDPKLAHREHSLAPVLERNFGVVLDKGSVRTSDWGAATLTEEQLSYAVADVAHLPALQLHMSERLAAKGLSSIFRAVCDFMPIHARLEIDGVPDPLTY